MASFYKDTKTLIQSLGEDFFTNKAKLIQPEKWQGMEISTKMIEQFDLFFRVPMDQTIAKSAKNTNPDLPWANDHFDERIGKLPTNPGVTFKYWPYYQEKEYREGGIFTHSYQERFWPKYAKKEGDLNLSPLTDEKVMGIRYELGDLDDVINHLAENPTSRQAYLPIWFPEDTGVIHKGRVPCSLGYLFSYREGYLHISYYLRSCDYVRHFRNDIYFANRLLLHVLSELSKKESKCNWKKVQAGMLKMHIESLHIFEPDVYELKKRLKQ